jgi:pepF/M3 family oligoendopeptidase
MKRIETKRLFLRPWTLEDAQDLFEYAKLKTVGPNAGWKPHQSLEESTTIIRRFIESNDVWAIELVEEHKVIGSIGLHQKTDIQGKVGYELGYVLSTPYEGNGFMFEAVQAVLKHAFLELKIPEIRVYHFVDNQRSKKVIERAGFQFEKEIEYTTHDEGVKHSYGYRLSKEQFQEKEKQMYQWNLDVLYKSFKDPAFEQDVARTKALIGEINDFIPLFKQPFQEAVLVDYLHKDIELSMVSDKVSRFASLRQSTNSTDSEAVKAMNSLQMLYTQLTEVDTLFRQWLKNASQLPQVIQGNPFLHEHEFMLSEIVQKAQYMLDEKTELLISKLRQNGSTSWGRLQSLLTSTVAVKWNDTEITLSEVRNLAYDASQEVRKNAYLAELKAYESIEKPIAFSLNSIKGEVNILSELRGFQSPLDQALQSSRLSQETLDTLLNVMREYLPVFRQYLRRKGQLLGHDNGLPFYDLFAPMGKSSKIYTVEEANAYILKNFATFSPRLAAMAKRAFDEQWIDYLPRKGKVGGAFCSNMAAIKQSRVLTNFDGAFGDIITIAHELGHAYHGEAIFGESILNTHYTMPVAETASTFCETIVNQAAMKDSTSVDEQIALLESSLQDSTQVIVDILSRFIFEKAVFDGRRTTVFDEKELKNMMIQAQLEAYGDGLDPQYLHPYMWVNKGHYYRGGLSFYNFPYAYGLLFAKGLYAKYLTDPVAFVPMYDRLLASTGKMSCEDVAKIAGIDVRKKEFWVASLELLKKDVERFLELTK